MIMRYKETEHVGKDPEVAKAEMLTLWWRHLREQIPAATKDQIGMEYLMKVLRVDEETALAFVERDLLASQVVGMRQAGVDKYEPDLEDFWRTAKKLIPEVFTSEEELQFLVEKGGATAVNTLLCELQGHPLSTESEVLGRISINAHTYK